MDFSATGPHSEMQSGGCTSLKVAFPENQPDFLEEVDTEANSEAKHKASCLVGWEMTRVTGFPWPTSGDTPCVVPSQSPSKHGPNVPKADSLDTLPFPWPIRRLPSFFMCVSSTLETKSTEVHSANPWWWTDVP